MSKLLEQLAAKAGLADVYTKVMNEERLSFDDGIRILRSRELAVVGGLANVVRERRHGRNAYFVRNMHLNPTNICTVDCDFCGFYRPYREKEKGWSFTLDRCFNEVRDRLDEPLTEVHIVGGHNPDLEYDYYLELMRGIHEIRPDMHIKAFTAAEYDFFAKRFKKPLNQIFDDFVEAGLGSLPGGGAEVLVERVRKKIYAKKLTAEKWIETMRAAHEHGLKSNATLLFGHVETLEERIEHMDKLRSLQDDTSGFMCFIPLCFHPENTALAHLPGPTGFDALMTIATSRLYLDNFEHIKAYWIMTTPRIAQIALTMGADDIDGTVITEKIVHMAGAKTPNGLTVEALCQLCRDVDRVPIQRDSVYNEVRRFDEMATAG